VVKLTNPTEPRKTRILLVAANRAFLHVTTRFLKRHDELVVVGAVDSGEDALAQVQELRPQVVVLDMDMPGQAGLETIHCLRTMLPQVGIIALSLLDAEGYHQAALAAGADDFVAKIVLSTHLLPAIQRAKQNGRSKPEPTSRIHLPTELKAP
jgi:DNA-binding NarL/FixJ family response regulator